MSDKKKEIITKLSKYFVLFCFISFCGWAWETIYRLIRSGKLVDRGFLTTPICPIYGSTILLIYFLIGTPEEGRGLLKNVQGQKKLVISYILMATLIPTIMELGVGFFFDKFLGMRLWDYTTLPLNIGGYVCLQISLFWGIGIFLLMRFIFPKLKEIFFKIPSKVTKILSIVFISIISVDFILCMIFSII